MDAFRLAAPALRPDCCITDAVRTGAPSIEVVLVGAVLSLALLLFIFVSR
jgi:hypothetical protein